MSIQIYVRKIYVENIPITIKGNTMKNRKLNNLRTAGMVWILGGLVIYLMYCGYGCASPHYFHKVVTLDKVTVHIVSDRSQFDCGKTRIKGCAKLHWEDREIANPDDLLF